MRPDDKARIRHMIEAGETAQRFVTGRQRSELDSDQMLLFALVRAVEVIGEAASRVSPETRERAPSVPWADVVAMRHRLVHAYFEIDRTIMWNTVTKEIPSLLAQLRAIVLDH